MGKSFISSLLFILPLLLSCQPDGELSFYAKFRTNKGFVITESQKQALKDGKYVLELKNILQRNNEADSLVTTEFFLIDTNYVSATHHKKLTNFSREQEPQTETLYVTSKKNFSFGKENVEIVRMRTAGSAYGCCVFYHVYFWNPALGVISSATIDGVFEGITDMAPESREYLHQPPDFAEREALQKLIFKDRSYFFHADSSQVVNSQNTLCLRPNTEVDNCASVLKIREISEENLSYPGLPVPKCYPGYFSAHVQLDVTGKVITDNPLSNSNSIRGLEEYNASFNDEVLKAIAELPNTLAPLTFEGIPIRTWVDLTFKFSIPDSSVCQEIISEREEEKRTKEANQVWDAVPQDPLFIGGKEALEEYLQQNLKFPPRADSSFKERKIYVRFVVGMDGTLKDITVLRSFEDRWKEDFEQEAIRLVEEMPAWEPGKIRGKSVSVRHTLLIDFSLVQDS